jgi:hypothetical protein
MQLNSMAIGGAATAAPFFWKLHALVAAHAVPLPDIERRSSPIGSGEHLSDCSLYCRVWGLFGDLNSGKGGFRSGGPSICADVLALIEKKNS